MTFGIPMFKSLRWVTTYDYPDLDRTRVDNQLLVGISTWMIGWSLAGEAGLISRNDGLFIVIFNLGGLTYGMRDCHELAEEKDMENIDTAVEDLRWKFQWIDHFHRIPFVFGIVINRSHFQVFAMTSNEMRCLFRTSIVTDADRWSHCPDTSPLHWGSFIHPHHNKHQHVSKSFTRKENSHRPVLYRGGLWRFGWIWEAQDFLSVSLWCSSHGTNEGTSHWQISSHSSRNPTQTRECAGASIRTFAHPRVHHRIAHSLLLPLRYSMEQHHLRGSGMVLDRLHLRDTSIWHSTITALVIVHH